MKKSVLTLSILISILSVFFFVDSTFASDEDFFVETKTEISYTTGKDYVTVSTEYIRTVKNSDFYFPAAGEKIFHIPDIATASEEHITKERLFKTKSISVKDDKGNSLDYSLEEKEHGEGIYVTIPNERATTSSAPYKMVFSYKTHDYVVKVGKFVNIIGTSLPRDTVFEQKDEQSGTVTKFNYQLSMVVDDSIEPLAKAFPSFTKSESNGKTLYTFSQTDRIGNSPYLEFGTSVIYRFELEYQTLKTDNLIPESYSKHFEALSTNIYEVSLPREFSETNQKVFFETVKPLPKSLHKDTEGNILALFEVPANKESKIKINGYIVVEQDEWEEDKELLDISFSDYLGDVKKTKHLSRYLVSTKYWQSNDKTIKKEAEILAKEKETLMDIIKANYSFVNEVLEYDSAKATSENERIGALEAFLGGPSVCMEYADLMIALLRAQGIPSRAAIGYANLTNITSTQDQVRHQWVQVWVPEYGWLSVDPSFESKNMKIGQMVDRVLWEVFNDESLSNIKIYSANNIQELTTEGLLVKVYGVEDEPNFKDFNSYTDLIDKDKIPENSFSQISVLGDTILKTTTLGKAIIVTLPILIVFGLLIGLISFSIYIYKKLREKKKKKHTI
ncbi:MAG: transglutaminase-like domain-containing protein [Candidatus Dojkabacteria bacterium]